MFTNRAEQQIDSSPFATRGIPRRRFLTGALKFAGVVSTLGPLAALEACSPARPSAPLGAGPGPGESGQDTTGLRSVPADVKTAVSEVFTEKHPSSQAAIRAFEATMDGRYEDFDQEVAPDRRFKPGKKISTTIMRMDIEALSGCKGVPYSINNRFDPKLNLRFVNVELDEDCILYKGQAPRRSMLYVMEEVNDEWFIKDFERFS